MRLLIIVLMFVSVSTGISAQTRQEAIEKLGDLRNQAESLEKTILSPDITDIETASQENVGVFRLLPREVYDKQFFSVRGGGAYYSFTKQSHSYNDTPQISLEQNYLKVGFYGASYGLMADLGNSSLAEIDGKTKSVQFLMNYEPSTELSKARIEQEKVRGFTNEEISYKYSLSAIVGHSFIVRAISYNEADALFAFKIYRKDSDGSLIVFWKLLKEFQVPKLKQTPSMQTNTDAVKTLRQKLIEKGFSNVIVDISTVPMTLRGTVAKGKLAEVIQTTFENNGGKPIKNEITEQ